MGKRASSVPKSPKKRVRTDPVLASVAEVIMDAEHLPDHCRSMLRDMLPYSLSIPSDKRHEAQTWVVSTVEQILSTQQAALVAAIAAEEAKLVTVKSAGADLVTAVAEAEAALGAQNAVVDDAMLKLAAALEAQTTATQVARTCNAESESSQSRLALAQTEKDELVSAFQSHFQEPMQAGNGPHFKELQTSLKKLHIDTALFNALPSCCKKAKEDRGSFDEAVLTELEKAFTSQINLLEQTISTDSPIAAEHKAKAEAADKDLHEKTVAQTACDDSRGAAQTKQAECKSAVAAAKKAVKAYQPQIDDATSSVEEAKLALTAFETGPSANFATYKNRVEVSPELAPGGA